MIEHLRSYWFKKPNNFYWVFLRIRMYQPIENKILLQVYLIVIIHVQDYTGYLHELIEPSYLFSVCTKNKIRNKSIDWIHLDKKYQNTSHFFLYKKWWRDMHIVHVFVWNLMIRHVFFSTNLTLIYLEISCTHIIAIAENHSKEITDNWKKKYKYTCIKTQMTNNQVHKKLTTSMKQLRKILIKNFLSIVQITHNIKMPFPFKTLESHDCTS